jgi:hypothetical protein
MTSTEISPGPIRSSAPVDAPARPVGGERETRPLKVWARILVWSGLGAAGAIFWLGVWKAIELIT